MQMHNAKGIPKKSQGRASPVPAKAKCIHHYNDSIKCKGEGANANGNAKAE